MGSPTAHDTLSDSYLRLLNSSGTQLAFNDDNGSTLHSRITFTAASTGTFYLQAGAYGTNTGSYTLTEQDTTPPATTDDYANTPSSPWPLSLHDALPISTGRIETASDLDV